jgi:hypothetical protein
MHKNKALVSLVFGLGIILFGGLVLLGYGLNQRADDPNFRFFKSNESRPAEFSKKPALPTGMKAKLPINISIPVAKGSRVSKVEASDGKIIVHITNKAKRDLILILDAETGAVLRRIRFVAQQ